MVVTRVIGDGRGPGTRMNRRRPFSIRGCPISRVFCEKWGFSLELPVLFILGGILGRNELKNQCFTGFEPGVIAAVGERGGVLPSKASANRIHRSNGGSQTSTSGASPSPAGSAAGIFNSEFVLGSIIHLTHKTLGSRKRLQEKDLPSIPYYFRTPFSV
jgi:hypothetical protein